MLPSFKYKVWICYESRLYPTSLAAFEFDSFQGIFHAGKANFDSETNTSLHPLAYFQLRLNFRFSCFPSTQAVDPSASPEGLHLSTSLSSNAIPQIDSSSTLDLSILYWRKQAQSSYFAY